MKNSTVKELFSLLREDLWRKDNAFNEDLINVQNILFHPFSTDDEKKEALELWLRKRQPCVFGQVAARQNKIFYCFITEGDLQSDDSEIRDKIQRSKKQWKQWSLDGATARHSFLLVIASPKVALASPDENLKAFATHLRSLFTEDFQEDSEANDLAFQSLYLKKPNAGFFRFTVIMDFFAAAGDKRWWSDHRMPGGMAFSFNSLGHMVRTKQWYEGDADPLQWALKLAMSTIANADTHPKFGNATWLNDLVNDKPLKNEHACPFSNRETLPSALKNKDWTSYSGFHHSDHNIREEFFSQRESPHNINQPFLIDFSYIYARSNPEDSKLMDGVAVSDEEVYADIGQPNEWRRAAPLIRSKAIGRPIEATREINESLQKCRQWLVEPDCNV